jgi:hypothetical protein
VFDFTGPVTVNLPENFCCFPNLEIFMSELTDALNALNDQADANAAAIQNLVVDVQALVAAVQSGDQTEALNLANTLSGKLTDEAASIASADSTVESATPTPTPGPTP